MNSDKRCDWLNDLYQDSLIYIDVGKIAHHDQ